MHFFLPRVRYDSQLENVVRLLMGVVCLPDGASAIGNGTGSVGASAGGGEQRSPQQQSQPDSFRSSGKLDRTASGGDTGRYSWGSPRLGSSGSDRSDTDSIQQYVVS